MRKQNSGFTLFELAAVVVVLTLLFMMVFPSLENMSPTYRLRSKVREVASTMEEARSEAVVRGQSYGISYDFNERKFGLLLPKDFDKDNPTPDRQVYEYYELGEGIEFKSIIKPGGKSETTGIVEIDMDPLGQEGSHIVEMENTAGRRYWIKFNSFTGIVTYSQKELTFAKYQGK